MLFLFKDYSSHNLYTFYLTINNNSSAPFAIEASDRVNISLEKAKEILLSLGNKMELTKNYISKTHKSITFSTDQFNAENEIIKRCLQRLNCIYDSAKVVSKKTLKRQKVFQQVSQKFESKPLKNLVSDVLQEKKSAVLNPHVHYAEVDINNRSEVAFWCKSFNVSRPELINAVEKINSKCWIELRKYFLENNKIACTK
jgi:hypothetical protein